MPRNQIRSSSKFAFARFAMAIHKKNKTSYKKKLSLNNMTFLQKNG
jgi:hypothetical protein